MHIAMRKVFSLEESPPVPPTIVDCDMLRMYAQEAEVCTCTCTVLLVHNVCYLSSLCKIWKWQSITTKK